MTERELLDAPPSVAAAQGRRPEPPTTHTAARGLASRTSARIWPVGPVLDQGRRGSCLPFAWVGIYMAGPGGVTNTPARVGYDYGLNFGAKMTHFGGPEAAVDRGMIESFYYLDGSVDALRDTILTIGPATIGLPWYDSCYDPTPGGRLIVKRRPRDPQWHALFVYGYHPAARLGAYTGPAFRVRNSWGRGWGLNGDFWITRADLTFALMADPNPAWNMVVPVGRTGVPVADLLRRNPDPTLS